MHRMRIVLLIAALACPLAVPAQSPAPAKAEAAPQPALLAMAQPRIPELRAAGVRQIVAKPANRRVQVLTTWGPAYVSWPKNVTPVPFELYLNSNGTDTAFGSDFNDANKAKYAAALDTIVPAALKAAASTRAAATRPKP